MKTEGKPTPSAAVKILIRVMKWPSSVGPSGQGVWAFYEGGGAEEGGYGGGEEEKGAKVSNGYGAN